MDNEMLKKSGKIESTIFSKRHVDATLKKQFALLVDFGTWPKAQIERYYYHDNKIKAF